MKVAIAGGGTAGHVNPALALAERLTEDEVVFIGTERGAEARLVPEAGFGLITIDVAGFDRARKIALPATGLRAVRALATSRRSLKRFAPDVVVGMGGYVSLPVCMAARTLRIPVVLHEQNIVLGLSNRICKSVATKVAVSFTQTLDRLGALGVHTGNPISKAIAEMDSTAERSLGLERFGLAPDRSTLLVFGGSLGAERLNRAALGLADVWSARTDLQIVHICGATNEAALRTELPSEQRGLIYRLVPYVQEMAQAYAVADLALCRGGATTVAEICAVGLPSIIVPYPYHRDMQQAKHGDVLESAGAATVVADADTTTQKVAGIAAALFERPVDLRAMAAAAKRLGAPDAADRLADVVRGVAA